MSRGRGLGAALVAAALLVLALYSGSPGALDDPQGPAARPPVARPEVPAPGAGPPAREGVPAPAAAGETDGPSSPPADAAAQASAHVLAGRVLAADGSRAEGALVTFEPPGGPAGKPATERAASDGSFEFAVLAPGKGFRLAAVLSERNQSASLLLDLPDLDQLPRVELQLEARAVLEGRVLDFAGAAVEGASVRLVHLPALALGSPDAERPEGIATTDAAGLYRLDGLSPGAKRLVVHAEGHPGRWIDLQLEPGELSRAIEVELPRGEAASGTARDPAGRPLAGAVVRFVRARTEPGDPGEERHARTAEGGGWRIEGLDPERWYEIEVYHPSLGRVWSRPDPVPGTVGELDLRVE